MGKTLKSLLSWGGFVISAIYSIVAGTQDVQQAINSIGVSPSLNAVIAPSLVVVFALVIVLRTRSELNTERARNDSRERMRQARELLRKIMNDGEDLILNRRRLEDVDRQRACCNWRSAASIVIKDCFGEQHEREFLNCAAHSYGPDLATDTTIPPPGEKLRHVYMGDWVGSQMKTYCLQILRFIESMTPEDLNRSWPTPPTPGTPYSPSESPPASHP